MKHQDLILNLAADLKPVEVVKFGLKHYLLGLLMGSFSIRVGIAITRIRLHLQTIAY